MAGAGRAYHLGVAPDELARCVFLVGDPARAYRVADRFDSLAHEVKNREFVTLTGAYRGLETTVVGTGIDARYVPARRNKSLGSPQHDLGSAVEIRQCSSSIYFS